MNFYIYKILSWYKFKKKTGLKVLSYFYVIYT